MQLWHTIRRLIHDPPPAYVFELSQAGIAWWRAGKEPESGFVPLDPGVLAISPLKDNVMRPDVLFDTVQSLAPANGKNRRQTAALILPDYCARVAVLDFDNLPSDQEEQESLVRFRMKKSIPFELDSAKVSYYVQSAGGGAKKYEVVATVVALEIVARYEAAFRSAGFEPGHVTTSSLSALALLPDDAAQVVAKMSGSVLTAAVAEGQTLRLLRCVELPERSTGEVLAVLYPTFAYVEDELGTRPESLTLCGFEEMGADLYEECHDGLSVEPRFLQSRHGTPGQTNAGLLGFLQGVGE